MHALTNALKIVNAFFANIVPIGDILWTFPQNFSWYANIPIIGSIPFAIYLLLGMGVYFSIRTKFVQFRYFKRGIQVLTKKKKDIVAFLVIKQGIPMFMNHMIPC